MKQGDGFTREVAGVAAGYVAIPMLTMLVTVVVTRFVGPGTILLRPDDVVPTPAWLLFGAGLAASSALLAGLLCGLIAHSRRASYLLAAVVLTMGVVLALPVLRAAPPNPGEPVVELEAIDAQPAPGGPAASFRAALAVQWPVRWLIWKPVVSAVIVLLAGLLVAPRR